MTRKRAFLLLFLVMFCVNSVASACFYRTPSVLSVTPGVVTNDRSGTLHINGAKFSKKAIVKLSMPGEPDLFPYETRVVSKNEIICSFDFNNQAVGEWDVTVINKSLKRVDTLQGALKLEYPAPSITRIAPASGVSGSKVNFLIQGYAIRENVQVKLVQVGQSDIVASKMQSSSNGQWTGEFVLPKTATGIYDVVVVNEDGKTDTLRNGFTVSKPASVTTAREGDSTTDALTTDKKAEESSEKQSPRETPLQVLRPIYFDFDSSAVRSDQLAALIENLFDIRNNNETVYILIGGNTDERGTRAYNEKLSARRAAAIKKYFVDRGVEANVIITFAFGEDYPVDNGQNETAWAANRRADISLWSYKPTWAEGLKAQP